MSADESKLIERLLNTQESFHQEMREDMASLKRGLYGDEKNKVPGLIEQQREDHVRYASLDARVKSLEGFKAKAVKTMVSIGGVFLFIIEFVSDWIKGWFK